MVKPKRRILQIFMALASPRMAWILPGLALLSFIFSWIALYPTAVVERDYARFFYPKISGLAGWFADSAPFSWLDVSILVAIVGLILLLRKRKWLAIANIVAAGYLVFFWTWGLNYHRQPLDSKLTLDTNRTQPDAMAGFAARVAAELNRLYPDKQKNVYDEARTRAVAYGRVRKVVAIIDGTDWSAAKRIKVSRLGDPWFRAAGIDGVFYPLAHEPIMNNSLLDIERPFVIAHELAHARGYPNEGDANVIATFATLMSDDTTFQYSGWLNLWLYLRSRDRDKLLDPGPRSDVQRIFERARAGEIRWINEFQSILLDWFLKANSVEEGVRSYSRVVLIAAASEPDWARFR
jgi:hypothetical protein